jgi:hypothetical protein
MTLNVKDLSEAGLPCFSNAERLARLETHMENIGSKLDSLIADPCHRCKNGEAVTTLRTEMKFVKWVGSVFGIAFLGTQVERFLK